MLRDELIIWQPLLEFTVEEPINYSGEQLAQDSQQIKNAWLNAAFSVTDEGILNRYFRFHQKRIQAALEQLQSAEHREFLTRHLKELQDFIRLYFPGDERPGHAERLALQLSGAQLACFIRLFCELDLYPAHTVTEVIRFMAGHFHTKMRQPISARGLSKEYYSISQKTAATCRELLQKMIQLLEKQFFP